MLENYAFLDSIFSATGATIIAIVIPLYFLLIKDIIGKLLKSSHDGKGGKLPTNFERRANSYTAPYLAI
jgi:hypothetical protein